VLGVVEAVVKTVITPEHPALAVLEVAVREVLILFPMEPPELLTQAGAAVADGQMVMAATAAPVS
jgi:hypothetical protein